MIEQQVLVRDLLFFFVFGGSGIEVMEGGSCDRGIDWSDEERIYVIGTWIEAMERGSM